MVLIESFYGAVVRVRIAVLLGISFVYELICDGCVISTVEEIIRQSLSLKHIYIFLSMCACTTRSQKMIRFRCLIYIHNVIYIFNLECQ